MDWRERARGKGGGAIEKGFVCGRESVSGLRMYVMMM